MCNLIFYVPNEIHVVFDNGSNYDYHFIIKEAGNEFECLAENTEKYKDFSVSVEKGVIETDKNGNESAASMF